MLVQVPTMLACEHEEEELTILNGTVLFLEEKLAMHSYCLLTQEGAKYTTTTTGLICKDITRTDKHLPMFKIQLMKYLYLVSVISLKVEAE